MVNGRGWGLVWVLALACLSACGGGSQAQPDAGGLAGGGAGMGYSGVDADGGSAGAGSSGAGGGRSVTPGSGCGVITAPTRAELGSKLEPIAGAGRVRAVHMTAKGVFWTAYQGIYRLQSDATGAVFAETGDLPDLLTSNATHVAWHGTRDGMLGIWLAPLDGGAPSLVTPANVFVEVLALDDTYAFFGGSVSDGLSRAALTGVTAATRIATPFGVGALAVAGGFAYYVETLEGIVLRIAAAGGTSDAVSPDIGMTQQLVVDANAIYAATLYGIYRIERDQLTEPKRLLGTARPTQADNNVTRMIDDGDRLVFADLLENIGWVSKDGTRCGYIVSEGTKQLAGTRSDIALDADYLYIVDWPTESLSRIKRADIGLAH